MPGGRSGSHCRRRALGGVEVVEPRSGQVPPDQQLAQEMSANVSSFLRRTRCGSESSQPSGGVRAHEGRLSAGGGDEASRRREESLAGVGSPRPWVRRWRASNEWQRLRAHRRVRRRGALAVGRRSPALAPGGWLDGVALAAAAAGEDCRAAASGSLAAQRPRSSDGREPANHWFRGSEYPRGENVSKFDLQVIGRGHVRPDRHQLAKRGDVLLGRRRRVESAGVRPGGVIRRFGLRLSGLGRRRSPILPEAAGSDGRARRARPRSARRPGMEGWSWSWSRRLVLLVQDRFDPPLVPALRVSGAIGLLRWLSRSGSCPTGPLVPGCRTFTPKL